MRNRENVSDIFDRPRKLRRSSLSSATLGVRVGGDEKSGGHFNEHIAVNEFLRISGGLQEISAARLEKELGWLTTPTPGYPLFMFAINNASQPVHDPISSVTMASWVSLARGLCANSLSDVVHSGRMWLEQAYRASSPEFFEFHKFVFRLLCSRKTSCDRTFVRTVPVSEAIPALMATLSQLSPFVPPFCTFLAEARVRVIALDQWVCFAAFIKAVEFQSLQNYDSSDCWPCILDDFVAWGLQRSVFNPLFDACEKK